MSTLATIILYLVALAFILRWHYVATGRRMRELDEQRRAVRPYNRRRTDKVA